MICLGRINIEIVMASNNPPEVSDYYDSKKLKFSGVVDTFISSHQLLSLTKAKNVVVLVQTNEIC